uniref:Uncharacterized protein n=1 Tax=Solanum lycopersicum TaxID=4081 RepID=A0A3Q7J7A1_SOLLC
MKLGCKSVILCSPFFRFSTMTSRLKFAFVRSPTINPATSEAVGLLYCRPSWLLSDRMRIWNCACGPFVRLIDLSTRPTIDVNANMEIQLRNRRIFPKVLPKFSRFGAQQAYVGGTKFNLVFDWPVYCRLSKRLRVICNVEEIYIRLYFEQLHVLSMRTDTVCVLSHACVKPVVGVVNLLEFLLVAVDVNCVILNKFSSRGRCWIVQIFSCINSCVVIGSPFPVVRMSSPICLRYNLLPSDVVSFASLPFYFVLSFCGFILIVKLDCKHFLSPPSFKLKLLNLSLNKNSLPQRISICNGTCVSPLYIGLINFAAKLSSNFSANPLKRTKVVFPRLSLTLISCMICSANQSRLLCVSKFLVTYELECIDGLSLLVVLESAMHYIDIDGI